MATISDLVESVKDNLGNRQTGNIGSRAINTVVLDELNGAMLDVAKSKKHIEAFEKEIQIAVTTSAYKYAIPTTDVNGATIRIKKMIKMVCVRSGETDGYPISRIHPLRRDTLFPLTNTSRTGRPSLYSSYAGYFEFFPYPDTSYTVTGRAIVWPTTLTINSSSTGLGEEFDDALIAKATHGCFRKLQQLEDAIYWKKEYENELRDTLASLDDYPDEEWFPAGSSGDLIGTINSTGPSMLAGRTSAYNSALGIS